MMEWIPIISLLLNTILIPGLFAVLRLIAKVQKLEEDMKDVPEATKKIVQETLNRSYENITNRLIESEKRTAELAKAVARMTMDIHRIRRHLKLYDEDNG